MKLIKNIKVQLNLDVRADFIIAGAQKCGTTALYNMLSKHEAFDLHKRKEQHFFDDIKQKYFNNNPSKRQIYLDYNRLYNTIDSNKITGDASPSYMWHPNTIERIHKVAPNIKWIILLRNPINRCYSQWNMRMRNKKELRSFDEVISSELLKFSNKNHAYRYHHWCHPIELTRGLYATQLRKLFNIVSKKKTLIITTAWLRENTDNNIATETVHQFLTSKSKFQTCLKIGDARTKPLPLKEETLCYLQKFYNNEINELSELLNFDFTPWQGIEGYE